METAVGSFIAIENISFINTDPRVIFEVAHYELDGVLGGDTVDEGAEAGAHQVALGSMQANDEVAGEHPVRVAHLHKDLFTFGEYHRQPLAVYLVIPRLQCFNASLFFVRNRVRLQKSHHFSFAWPHSYLLSRAKVTSSYWFS